jgi:hypothetical protein
MGGKNSFINRPLGSVGDDALGKNNFFTNALNVGLSSAMTGGLSLFTNPNSPIEAKKGAGVVAEGVGEITGSNAMRKQAMDQQQANEEATKRAADASDAASRAAGGDPTAIFLATGKKKKGTGGSGTGSAGTGSSRDTGVQS